MLTHPSQLWGGPLHIDNVIMLPMVQLGGPTGPHTECAVLTLRSVELVRDWHRPLAGREAREVGQ